MYSTIKNFRMIIREVALDFKQDLVSENLMQINITDYQRGTAVIMVFKKKL